MEQKWLQIKKEITFKKTVGCTRTTDLRNLGIIFIRLDVSGSNIREN
jgi:hypothetical protein